ASLTIKLRMTSTSESATRAGESFPMLRLLICAVVRGPFKSEMSNGKCNSKYSALGRALVRACRGARAIVVRGLRVRGHSQSARHRTGTHLSVLHRQQKSGHVD